MAEVGFYHLTRSTLLQALPQLLRRTLAAGERAVVLCPSSDSVALLDKALWETTESDWLPHGTPADGDPDLQPIWIATDDAAPNGARYLFVVAGAASERMAEFNRVFDLFDGNDQQAVAAARERWKAVRQAGHTLAYWQQNELGWQKKA